MTPAQRFDRLTGALAALYDRGDDERVNHTKVALAFATIAIAADDEQDVPTMFGAMQLARTWGFNWRQWLLTTPIHFERRSSRLLQHVAAEHPTLPRKPWTVH